MKCKKQNKSHLLSKIVICILWEFHWLHAVSYATICLDSYLTCLFFFFVFESILLIYNVGMINHIHLTCAISWAVTDVHTFELLQWRYRTFLSSSKDSLLPHGSPSLLRPHPRQPLHTLCHYSSPSSRSPY